MLKFMKGAAPPVKAHAGKHSFSTVVRGLNEVPVSPNDPRPGDRATSSARPRVSSSESFVDGCFCNKRGQ